MHGSGFSPTIQEAGNRRAGTAALILSLNNDLETWQVRKTLCLSADKVAGMIDTNHVMLDSTARYANGRLNAYKAVRNLHVPDVYDNPDSACKHLHWGQAAVLQNNTGTHTLAQGTLMGPNQWIEVHPGDTLVIQDTLDVDSLSYIQLISDSTGLAVIEFGTYGYLRLHSPLSLSGTGVLKQARIHWTSDYQLGPEDSLVFMNGGTLSFGPSYHVMNINGTLIFDGGTFFLEDSIRALYVASIDSSRPALFQTLPGTTLDGVPGIQAYLYSLVKAEGASGQECSWRFRPRYGDRFHAGFDIYNRFEAQYTTFQGSGCWNDSCLWAGIFVGGDSSSIHMDYCTVTDIYTDSASLHGTGILIYGSPDTTNHVSHSRILREGEGAPYAGDGIFVQCNLAGGTPRSYATLNGNCIGSRWWTGNVNVMSDTELKDSKIWGNFQGDCNALWCKSFLSGNCITLSETRGIFGTNWAEITFQAMSGSPADGRNTISEHGPSTPGGPQVVEGQIVLDTTSFLNITLPDALDQNNVISHSNRSVTYVYSAEQSIAQLRKNYWGFQPDSICILNDGIFRNATSSSMFHPETAGEIYFEPALCDDPGLPACDSGCEGWENPGSRVMPGIPLASSVPIAPLQKVQPTYVNQITSALLSFRMNILQSNNVLAYDSLARFMSACRHDARILGSAASIAWHAELDYQRIQPVNALSSSTRFGRFLLECIDSASSNDVKAALREILCYVYAHAGDVPSAEQGIAFIRTNHAGTPESRRILYLKILCAMARSDTLAVDGVIGEMIASGYPTDKLHLARSMRAAFLRFKPAAVSFRKLALERDEDAWRNSISVTNPPDFHVINYPNPFSGSTVLRYTLPKDGYVTVSVFTLMGAQVATLVREKRRAGTHQVEFRSDRNLSSITDGIYFYIVSVDDELSVGKMIMR